MARAATTSDVFNAIAEPQRREILMLLRAGERPVTELARELGMAQPRASKHLRVLREVGLVRDRKAGKQRLYGLVAREVGHGPFAAPEQHEDFAPPRFGDRVDRVRGRRRSCHGSHHIPISEYVNVPIDGYDLVVTGRRRDRLEELAAR